MPNTCDLIPHLHYGRSARSSQTICCPRQCYLAGGDIRNEKTSSEPLPQKADTERQNNLKTYEMFAYGNKHYITRTFCKNVVKIVTP